MIDPEIKDCLSPAAIFAAVKSLNSKKILIFITSCLLFTSISYPQNITLQNLIAGYAEQLAEEDSDPGAAEIFTEKLEELAGNPVRINSGDVNEISRLFFLSDYQVRTLTDHIKNTGSIVSVYEIASIPGFDRAVAEIMVPFIILSKEEANVNDSVSFRSNLIINTSLKPGESDTSMCGNQLKILTKYRLSAGRFSAGFTMEKDPGEKIFPSSFPVPDFVSGYISYSGNGAVKQVVAGDFSVRLGQGTNICTGMKMRLPVASGGYLPGRDDIRPYTSSDENNFFRGIAATIRISKLELSLFLSHNKTDATKILNDDSSKVFIKSLYTTGLHNTVSSLARKDVLPLTDIGASVLLNLKSARVGMVFSHSSYGIPFLPSDDPEDLFAFSGTGNSVYSVYYNRQLTRSLLFGEISLNDFRHYAIVQGIGFRPSDRLTINVLCRNYSPGFTAIHARGPGLGSITGNEYGLTGSFTFEAAKHLFIMAGADICRFPWLKYRTSSPTRARRYEVRLSYIPGDAFSFSFSYNFRYQEYDTASENGIPPIAGNVTHYIKNTFRYSPSENFSVSSRFDFKYCNTGESKGILMLEDMSYRLSRFPLTIWFRYCIFNTDDWDSRLYAYENDMLYSFSIPALSGMGTRSYMMLKWEPGRHVELRFKYGITSVTKLTSPGNNDEIKIQMKMWF